MSDMVIGTAKAKRGRLTTGWLDVVPLPGGGGDRIPVMVAHGPEAGPVLWITAGIHGTEHTGPLVVQEFMTPALARQLRGTLIAIPTLNPAGLRTKQRSPYYVEGDPNRLFPKPGGSRAEPKAGAKPRSDLEIAYCHVYDAILSTRPAALLDLHNASIGSLPFTLRDPVFFRVKRGESPSRQQAAALQDRVGELVGAIGFTAINEFAADTYISLNLDRSVSGSILNGGSIPALTMELGSWMHVDSGIVEACKAGLRNALRWAGMLDGAMEAITTVPVIRPNYPVRRADAVYASHTGFVHHLVRPGEMIERDQPLARMTDIFGKPLGDDNGLIRSANEGFVYGWNHGIVRYRGETIMTLAIRDTQDMIMPYPD